MPYITTRLKPAKKEISINDFLKGLITLDMLEPPKSYQATGTRTYYYDHITRERLQKIDIPYHINALELIYDAAKHMDICNDHPKYNYEKQFEIEQELKRDGVNGDELRNRCEELLRGEGLLYNPLYSTFFIPKSSSKPGQKKWRRIDAPCDDLKMALRTLKFGFEVMMDGCYYHTSAFAYVKNRRPADAVAKHANNKSNWFLKIDFSNFFGSITLDFAMKMLSDVFPFSEIVKDERGKTALKNCLNLCFLDGCLPQGTPMSPTLTNILMIPIDYHLSNELSKHGYIYTRYADDICISHRLKFDKDKVINHIYKVLDKFEAPFKLNDKKTRYGSNAGENWMLGLMLNQNHKATVGHKNKKVLKAMLTNYMLDRKNGNGWGIEDVQSLSGKISYYMSIEPDMIKRILDTYSKKFGDIRAAIKEDTAIN